MLLDRAHYINAQSIDFDLTRHEYGSVFEEYVYIYVLEEVAAVAIDVLMGVLLAGNAK